LFVSHEPCASAMLLVVSALEACALDTYITAIYEHNVVVSEDTEVPVSPEEALMLMDKNRAILEVAIKAAARQGAHIIVTPEDGIYVWVFTINPYLKDVPDPQVDWILCADPGRYHPCCPRGNGPVRSSFRSGYTKPCNSSDPRCPSDGRCRFNTNVVFDSEGKLVAHYHKVKRILQDSGSARSSGD
uniref:CN hydrolase domain-containing protein n=1 Tax=Calidris pygmaea TaxID=425635 RepID=A0A8C3JPF6_9CHAR